MARNQASRNETASRIDDLSETHSGEGPVEIVNFVVSPVDHHALKVKAAQRLVLCLLRYSALSAWIGSRRTARVAGYRPNATPTLTGAAKPRNATGHENPIRLIEQGQQCRIRFGRRQTAK